MRLAAVVLMLAAPVAAQPAPGWQAQFDALWKTRDQPGVVEQLHQMLNAPLAADAKSFDANLRLSALYNWEANNTDGDAKANLGKKAWQAGDIAADSHPDSAAAQYQAGTGIGQYSEGVGILKAMTQGLEGKFRDRLQAALKLDKDYLDGAPQVVWGRYFFKLPWPKKNVDESIRVLTAAMESHPKNLRAKLYLADSLADEGSGDDAKKLVKEVIAAPDGEDPPETHLIQSLAKKWMSAH